jgi:hypothetical protein
MAGRIGGHSFVDMARHRLDRPHAQDHAGVLDRAVFIEQPGPHRPHLGPHGLRDHI